MPLCPVSDTEVHYEVGGHGPAVLLLNGLVASAFLWPRRWRERLERSHRVIRVSNRGTGHTVADGEMLIPELALDAVAVLDASGVDRAHVVGFSMGGMVAQAIALDHPERVGALTLCSTTTGGVADVHPEFVEAIGGSGGDTVRAAGAFFHLLTGAGFFDEHPEALGDLAEGWQQAPTPPATAGLQLMAAAQFDSRSRLGEIASPTLVLHGTVDRLLVPAGGERLAAGIPGARLQLFEGVGHMLPYEATDESLDLVEGLFARTPLG